MTKFISGTPATGHMLPAEITDKRGFAQRWQFSPRMVDNFLKAGLPHLKIGSRRVRIVVTEADSWMLENYGTRRRGPAKANTEGARRR